MESVKYTVAVLSLVFALNAFATGLKFLGGALAGFYVALTYRESSHAR